MLAKSDVLHVGGLQLAYVRRGVPGAPAVVFLHGWASSSRMWESAQSALADDFDTVAIDLPGHGGSTKPAWRWYTSYNITEAVRQACVSLGLRTPSLIGHSMGGTIALELAASPDFDVDRLVLVNPVVTGVVTPLSHPIREEWMRPVVRMSRRLWPMASRLLAKSPSAVRTRLPNHVVRNQEDLAQTTADSALGSIRAVLAWDVRSRLGDIRAPTLVMVGDLDRTVPPREGMVAVEQIRGARLVRFRGGHSPSDEDPRAFEAELTSFLAPSRLL
ncbi:MAG TPA: alpha/beta hydrolase [Anaerolineales bacterium]|nr:alpha/beta hydrolase [Anaerolineales bacterium]